MGNPHQDSMPVDNVSLLRTAAEKAGLPGFSDAQLAKFLAARKGDVSRALTLIQGQVAWKKEKFGMAHLDTPSAADVMPLARSGFVSCPGLRDKNGCLILFIRPGRLDLDRFEGKDIVRLLWYVLDKACDDEATRTQGFTVCEDLAGLDSTFLTKAIPGVPREVLAAITGCVPARLRGVYLINQPWFVENALFMAKSTFIPSKLGGKMHVCGEDVAKVHVVVEPDQLPGTFGGTRGDLDVLNEEFMQDEEWWPPAVRAVQRRLSE